MTDTGSIVYLEDLESPRAAATVDGTAVKAAVTVTAKDIDAAPTKAAPVKRQRTLMDMFDTSAASKKPKLTASGSSSSLVADSSVKVTAKAAVVKVGGLQTLNSIPFSKASYVQTFSEEQRKLLKLECDAMGMSWLKLLKDEIKKPYFSRLKTFLWEEGVTDADSKNHKVFPSPRNIYAWSRTPLGKVKVVIIGQDPYHGPGQAHGLCFSVPPGVQVPPSLRNIYAEIKAEYPDFTVPRHGNLTAWADNGVLLLNTCLTVRAGNANSHSGKGWEEFTDKVVDVVDKYGGANLTSSGSSVKAGYGRGVVFLAWGKSAISRVAKLDKKKHLILTSAHPSPLSANKGFLGNGHFRKANEWLEERYGPDAMVDWCALDAAQ
ncbi:uracil-DNA glycosylase [Heliocybe sulcata]|uniref:Uracil-DNA glycosylase n=1 Tax=Heliocybe sulcata TaxID=5364 RepID=A0A5C3MY16_9AGAM|nr:uracil-DNA glycosylase [Heliocybe sulcata]